MSDLLRHHVGHAIGRGPHALADLRLARKPAGKPDANVAILIGLDPRRRFHLRLGHHRPAAHRGVDFVAGTIEEAGVDEHDPVLHGMDARREIGRCPPLFIHHADLDRVPIERQQILHRIEQPIGEAAFRRPVHLRLDDVDRSRAAVAQFPQPAQIVKPDQAGHHCVENALRRFRSIAQQHRRRRHQMPDIADEQQRATGERHGGAIGRLIRPILGQPPRHVAAALRERLLEIAAHQAQPVAIRRHLVLGIHRRDRILQIDDRRQRRFEHHIGDPRRIAPPDRMAAIDHDLDMQPVVPEQQRRSTRADKLRRIAQRELATMPVGPRTRRQWHSIVEKRLGPRDHLRPALGVVTARPRLPRQRIGAIERVVQAPPARIGGVEHEPRVERRHHQLRPRHPRDLVIDVRRADRERRGLIDQIADLSQESRGQVRAGIGSIPVVDALLKIVALCKQRPVLGREPREYLGHARPETACLDPQWRQHLVLDEGRKRFGDGKAGTIDHKSSTFVVLPGEGSISRLRQLGRGLQP